MRRANGISDQGSDVCACSSRSFYLLTSSTTSVFANSSIHVVPTPVHAGRPGGSSGSPLILLV